MNEFGGEILYTEDLAGENTIRNKRRKKGLEKEKYSGLDGNGSKAYIISLSNSRKYLFTVVKDDDKVQEFDQSSEQEEEK